MDADTASGPFKERLRTTAQLLGLAMRLTWRASPPMVVGILLMLTLQSALSPVQLLLSRLVLDRASLDLGLQTVPDRSAELFPLSAWIAMAAIVIAAGQLMQPFSSTLQSLVGDRLTSYVTGQLISVTNRWQGIARFEDASFADDLQRTQRSASRGGLDLLVYGARAVLSLCTAVWLALVLGRLHPVAPLVVILATLPQMQREWEYKHRTGSHLYAPTPEARRLQYYRDVMVMPEAAKDIRLYGMGAFFRQRYDSVYAPARVAITGIRRRLVPPVAIASALGACAAGAVYVYVVWRVASGQATLGDLALYGGAATMLHGNLLSLGFDLGFMPLPLGFLPSLFRVLEATPDLPVPDQPLVAPRPVKDGLVFDHVTFTYPGTTHPVLRDLSCTLAPCHSVALVGHNGAGKTTIVKLLLRLYDPTSGRITLDGVDLRDYDIADLRREMGVIFQDFVRYELTARENVGVGCVEVIDDRTRLDRAVARAGGTGLMQSLPDGLDTQLGRELGGRELSGGEWQKLALARAFLRDSQILVLDEPTAALDVQTEYDVYTRFHDLTEGKMTLLISHRFSTVRMAHRILYLEGGQVREEGTHAELLARNGEYARLYRLQASQYVDSAVEDKP